MINTIQRGVQIPRTRRPPHFHSRGYTLSAPDAAWAEGELGRWRAAGYLREVDSAETARMHCVVVAFVTRSAGKLRLAVDSRHPEAVSSSGDSSTRRCGS